MKRLFCTLIILAFLVSTSNVFAQNIRSSVEFLRFNVNLRSAAMGNTCLGRANAMYLYGDLPAFHQMERRVYASYSLTIPQASSSGTNLFHAISAGYKVLPKWSVQAGTRVQLGLKVPVIDIDGVERGTLSPCNWSADLGTTYAVANNWVVYARVTLIGSYHLLHAVGLGGSLGVNYRNQFVMNGYTPSRYSVTFGLNNFGGDLKFKSIQGELKVPLPSAIHLGGSIDAALSQKHKLTLSCIAEYLFPASLSHKFMAGIGAEYQWNETVAARTGFQWKDNRAWYTIGLGTSYRMATFDLSYIINKDYKFNQFGFGLSVNF